MNKQAEALIERTKLTDEEHFYLHFATPYKCTLPHHTNAEVRKWMHI